MAAVTQQKQMRSLWILAILCAAGGAVIVFMPGGPPLSLEKIANRLGLPLVRLILYMGVGLLVGQAIESLGWTARLAAWVRPLMRWGHLKDESGAAFTAAFVSGILANTMLMTYHKEEKLDRREMILTYLMDNGLPVYLLHLPTTFFIIAPLTGVAGMIYLALGLGAAVLRTLVLLVYARIRLSPPPRSASKDAMAKRPLGKSFGVDVWNKFRGRFQRVVLVTIPIYAVVFLISERGFFTWLRETVSHWVSVTFLPVEAASVVVFSIAAEFTSGVAAAGALLDAGALTVKQTVLALLIGSIVAAPIRAFRHQLPSHAGIFSPGLGMKMLALSQAMRVLSLFLVMILYGFWG